MGATKEDTDFLEEFNKFFEEKFRVDEVINNIKSKISREVEESLLRRPILKFQKSETKFPRKRKR